MSERSDDLMEYDEAATTAMDLTNLNDSQLDAAATALNEEIDDDRVQDALATLPAGKDKMPAAAAAAGGLFGDNVLTIEKPTKRKAATAAEAAFVENVDSDDDVHHLKTLVQKGNATLARPVDQSESEFSDSDDDDYLKKKAMHKYVHLTTEHYVNRQLNKDNAELEKKVEESNKLEVQVTVPLKLYHNDHPDEKGMIGVLAAAFVKALRDQDPDLRDALIGATDVLKSSIALRTEVEKTMASIDVGEEKLQELKERAEQKASANAELKKNAKQFINSQKKAKKKHNAASSSRQ